MKRFIEFKRQRTAALQQHPFISWLDADNVAVEDKLSFAPIMTLFVMAFRDVNLWVLRFEEDTREHFESLINGNTFEDETHSRMFLDDWASLGLDQRLGWSASDMLWWLFHSPAQERFRGYGVEFVRFSVEDGDDPHIRFSHSESGEACGMVFFSHAINPALALTQATGKTYRYFGPEHLNRELSHVEHTEEDFDAVVLDDGQLAQVLDLGGRMFDIFEGIFDAFLDYSRAYVETGSLPALPRSGAVYEPPPRHPLVSFTPAELAQLRREAREPSTAAQHLRARLEARMERAAAHPLYAWMREAQLPAVDMLRRFVPLWTMDVLGYRDLNHFVFHYPEASELETRLLNAWVNELETHSGLFLADWEALAFDEVLGWTASETLEFLFFDRAMDVHRHNIMRFMKLGLRHERPVLRYWLMRALEASGEAFFAHTKQLAIRAEAEGCPRLDYLGDRHTGGHPTRGFELDAALMEVFESALLDAEEIELAARMIDVVFDSLEQQLDLSLEAGLSERLLPGTVDAAAQ